MFVKDEGQRLFPVSLVSQKKQPLTRMQDYPAANGEKSSVRSSDGGGIKTFLTKNSAASRSRLLAAKSSSVRSSCHDACKFGHHHAFPEPDATKSGSKSTAKKPFKVSAAKVSRPAVAAMTEKISKSPVKSGDSGASVKKSGAKLNSGGQKLSSASKSFEKLNSFGKSGKKLNSIHISVEKASSTDKSGGKFTSVNKSGGRLSSVIGNGQLSGEKSVKSIRTNTSTQESKFKVARSLFRSPRAPSGTESLKIPTSKISMDDISHSVNFHPKAARSLIPAFESPRQGLLSRTFSSELSFKILDDKAEEEFFRQFSPVENAVKSHDEISFEAFSGEQSSDYSEISPRSLEAYLQEAYDYVGKNSIDNSTNAESMKMRFRRRREVNRDPNAEPESVILRHQDVKGRKASEEYLINHAIEEVVSKLSHTQESKVKVLVGAFETVMNLKDSQNTDNDHMRHLEACN